MCVGDRLISISVKQVGHSTFIVLCYHILLAYVVAMQNVVNDYKILGTCLGGGIGIKRGTS